MTLKSETGKKHLAVGGAENAGDKDLFSGEREIYPFLERVCTCSSSSVLSELSINCQER
jgi:hypothetical protein